MHGKNVNFLYSGYKLKTTSILMFQTLSAPGNFSSQLLFSENCNIICLDSRRFIYLYDEICELNYLVGGKLHEVVSLK